MKTENIFKMVVSAVLTLFPGVLVTILSNIMPLGNAPIWMVQMGDGLYYMMIGISSVLAIIDVICMLITEKTNSDGNEKVKDLLFWLLPVISFVTSFFLASYLFGFSGNSEKTMVILFAVMFIVIGNYLPKCKKNTTVGIKVKWALQNNRNWEATHRFCGRLWVCGGFLMTTLAFLPGNIGVYGFIIITLILAFVPFLYSYLFYRNQVKKGTYNKDAKLPKVSKGLQIFSIIVVAVIVIFVLVLLFAGSIEYKFRNHYLTVEASFFSDIDINYQDIARMEYVDEKVGGRRVMGLGTARLACGSFESDTLGAFTSYRYTGTDAAVVITTEKGEIIVLSAKDEKATKDLYDSILERL